MGGAVLIRGALVLAAIVVAVGSPAAADGGRVTGKVAVTEADGKPATGAEVIVYVVGYAEPASTTVTTVAQKDRRFQPELVAITKDETITFPNKDVFFHNVFSQSTTRPFDLGSFKKGESKDKQFSALGVVDVYCNIHPEMAATILVVPNQRHTRANPDGTFVIDGVKPGSWTVFAYTRRATRPASAKVTVVTSADTAVQLALTRGAEPAHPNKFGEKYGVGDKTYR